MSVWSERDGPVLRHLAEYPVVHGVLFTESRLDSPREGLSQVTEADFDRAVEVLHDAGYVQWGDREPDGDGGRAFTHFQVTGAGKQALGLWPMFSALGEPSRLADLLAALAEDASTEEERSYLHRASEIVRTAAPATVTSLLTGVLGGLARGAIGLP